MRIEDISSGLVRNADGIYVSAVSREVSFPTEGHSTCLQVEDNSFWFRHRNRCISAVIANHPFSGPMLDLGGGNGYVSERLVADGHQVILVEPGAIGAINAHKLRGLEHVVCATVEDAGFTPGTFGAIGMFDVIEHIEDDRVFLERIAPLLAPGGYLYLTVPCHSWLWSGADVEAGHFRRHTLRSLRELLDGLFAIDYMSYFFQPLVLPQYLLRALPYRVGIGRDKQMLSAESEHGTGNGLAVRTITHLLDREARKIADGKQIAFGASCLVAARLV